MFTVRYTLWGIFQMWFYIAVTGMVTATVTVEGMWDAMLGFAVHHSGALRRFAHLAIRVFSGDI